MTITGLYYPDPSAYRCVYSSLDAVTYKFVHIDDPVCIVTDSLVIIICTSSIESFQQHRCSSIILKNIKVKN